MKRANHAHLYTHAHTYIYMRALVSRAANPNLLLIKRAPSSSRGLLGTRGPNLNIQNASFSLVSYSIIRVASTYSAHGARNANINRGKPNDVFGGWISWSARALLTGLPRASKSCGDFFCFHPHTHRGNKIRYANVHAWPSLDLRETLLDRLGWLLDFSR